MFFLGGLAGEEKLVIVILLGLALAAGALLWWQGQAPGSKLAWEGAPASSPAPANPGAGAAAGPVAGGDPGSAGAAQAQATEEAIVVHVAGAVARPGVYSLPAVSRAIDAVNAAGGVTGAADGNAVNLARSLQDGERLYIPTREETRVQGQAWPTGAPGAEAGAAGSVASALRWPLNLNTATAAELDTLPGIGPTLAARIILYRSQNGPFAAPEELMNVSGIGQKKYEELAGLVTVR